jgi:phosphatidate cytidylyltransferase
VLYFLSMLKTRVLTAMIGIPLFLFVLFLPGGVPFLIAVCLMVSVGLWEFRAAHHTGLKAWGAEPNLVLTFAGLLFPLWSLWVLKVRGSGFGIRDLEQVMAACLIVLLLACLLELMRSYKKSTRPVTINLGIGMVGALYVGGLFAFVAGLRMQPGEMTLLQWTVDRGACVVLYLMLMLWVGDSAAYFVGRAFGKHKMAPQLSLGKTWEGAIANLAGCLAVGLALSGWLGYSLWMGALFGAGVGVLGQFGDLFESALKRALGIKDFGGLLPGHGGVLDRFDSLLFAGVWVYLLV